MGASHTDTHCVTVVAMLLKHRVTVGGAAPRDNTARWAPGNPSGTGTQFKEDVVSVTLFQPTDNLASIKHEHH